MTAPSIILKDVLVGASVGVFAAQSDFSIYVAKQPDSPDACVTLYDTGGENPNPKWLLDFPSVQIMVRGKENGYLALWAKVKEIMDALLGHPGADLAEDRLVSVRLQGGPAFLGYDERKRPSFSLNWTLIIEPTAGTYRDSL